MDDAPGRIARLGLYDDSNAINVRMARAFRPLSGRLIGPMSDLSVIEVDRTYVVPIHNAALGVDDVALVGVNVALSKERCVPACTQQAHHERPSNTTLHTFSL